MDTKNEEMVGKFRKAELMELKSQQGLEYLVHITNPDTGHEVVCRPIMEPDYLRFQDWLDAKGGRSLATQKLVRLVLLKHDPGHPDVDDMFRRFPALAECFCEELLRRAGFSKKAEGKVL